MTPELRLITAMAQCDKSLKVFAANLAARCAGENAPRRNSVGPIWTTSPSRGGFGYLDGQVLHLRDGREVAMHINLGFFGDYIETSADVTVTAAGDDSDEVVLFPAEVFRSDDPAAIAEATLRNVAAICRDENLLADLGVPQSRRHT